MSQVFTVADVVARMGDWVSNYSTGQVTTAIQIRAVDHSVNLLKRMLGFPQDEVKTTFWYTSSNFFYNTPSDFQDPIGLYFDQSTLNNPRFGARWEYRPYTELMVRTGNYPSTPNMYSVTTVNGTNQVMLLGSNTQAGATLDTLSAINNWTVANGASALAIDPNNYPVNFGITGQSLKFTGAAYGTNPISSITNPSVIYSIPNLVADNVFLNLYVMSSSANITSYTLKLTTDAGDYYTFTATTDYLGATFTTSTFQKITWKGSQAVITGVPNPLVIKTATVSANVNSSYTGGTFWVSTLSYVFPDLMDLYYYSTIKGTDVNGNPISKFSALTDGMSYDYDFIEPIALRAAFYAMPSLRADPAFMQLYKSEFTDFVRLYSRSHPKQRGRNDRTRTRLSR